MDDELIEEDYDDIQEKKFTQTAQEGFVAISDKFWVTSIIPAKGKEFKTTFDYKISSELIIYLLKVQKLDQTAL